jgi:hypothetical protein
MTTKRLFTNNATLSYICTETLSCSLASSESTGPTRHFNLDTDGAFYHRNSLQPTRVRGYCTGNTGEHLPRWLTPSQPAVRSSIVLTMCFRTMVLNRYCGHIEFTTDEECTAFRWPNDGNEVNYAQPRGCIAYSLRPLISESGCRLCIAQEGLVAAFLIRKNFEERGPKYRAVSGAKDPGYYTDWLSSGWRDEMLLIKVLKGAIARHGECTWSTVQDYCQWIRGLQPLAASVARFKECRRTGEEFTFPRLVDLGHAQALVVQAAQDVNGSGVSGGRDNNSPSLLST